MWAIEAFNHPRDEDRSMSRATAIVVATLAASLLVSVLLLGAVVL